MRSWSKVDIGDVAQVWRRNRDVYRRLWRTEIIAPMLEPLFSIMGFGWGVGSLVAGKVMGVSYLTFVGAGLLTFTSLLRALFECTYAAYFRMVYQSTYDAILATPVEVESLALGEMTWGVTKSLIDGLIVLGVLWAFGAVLSPWALLIPFIIVIGAFWVAALSLWITAMIHDINYYNFYLGSVFSYLWFSGAYFPLDSLPAWAGWLAWMVPVTSVIDALRSLMMGHLTPLLLLEMGYVLVAFVLTAEVAMRALRRRMIN